jgi:hypothetical protein
VLDDSAFISYRAVMTESAARHGLPLICGFREMTHAGCLFSYSVSLKDMWYRSATYVDKILKGAKPSDLPVQQGTEFELVINLKTARALGIEIPPTVLARAVSCRPSMPYMICKGPRRAPSMARCSSQPMKCSASLVIPSRRKAYRVNAASRTQV